jgi:hypothetical protein
MFDKVNTGHGVRRHSKVCLTAAAVAALAVLAVTQTVGSAAAVSQTGTGQDWECETGTACLWKNSRREGNTSEKLIINPGNSEFPDMEEPTPLGRKGVVRSTTRAFHDNISLGLNLMSWDLCMIDTQPLDDGEYQNWGAIVVIPASGGEFWAGHKQPYNDAFDTYTTARPGQCPSYVRFKGENSYIIESS